MSDEEIPGLIGSRRAARERAVELAYESEVRKITADAVLDSQLTTVDPFVVDLLVNAEVDRARAEQLISENSRGWAISRIATMDKVIMRLAISELIQGKIPVGVVLNEAVAMAGRYSTAESSRFVNGVLSSVAEVIKASHAADTSSSNKAEDSSFDTVSADDVSDG